MSPMVREPLKFHSINTRMPLEMYKEVVRLSEKMNVTISAVNRLSLSELLKRKSIESSDKLML